MDLIELLAAMVVQQASDLFISVDCEPLIKVEGKIRPVRDQRLDEQTNHDLIYSILDESEIATFNQEKELNKSLKIESLGRFRINVFQQSGEPAMVVRYIKKIIPSLEDLGLPDGLKDLIMLERGLILLVGSTGTGKSTTLASMIDYRNTNQAGHILTIEDPIEFTHRNKKSLVNQREVGVDTESFEIALKNAMREAPDVILIGEIRDRQTMKQALTYAETGHLCLATLHASNANQALERIFNFFPEEAKQQILQDLALNLRAVVAQRLCIGLKSRRVAAVEMMQVTPYVKELIEFGKIEEIRDAMERAEDKVNQTFDQCLYKLIKEEKITLEEGLRKADSKNNLALKFRLESDNGNEKETSKKDNGSKAEYSIDKDADFEHYQTYSIKPLKSNSNTDTTTQKVNMALMLALDSKGLRLVERNADLEVQYSFGKKREESLKLESISGKPERFNYMSSDDKEYTTLVITILDVSKEKAIFRISATKKKSVYSDSQRQLNEGMGSLLKVFPING
ncbi:MAG: PilT/PilU family type 4a pilus ATPase [Kangiellaceae bacterium]|nr:PilT/PilU family type 4a pilus ATPase [Kangiellaceae bacterium]